MLWTRAPLPQPQLGTDTKHKPFPCYHHYNQVWHPQKPTLACLTFLSCHHMFRRNFVDVRWNLAAPSARLSAMPGPKKKERRKDKKRKMKKRKERKIRRITLYGGNQNWCVTRSLLCRWMYGRAWQMHKNQHRASAWQAKAERSSWKTQVTLVNVPDLSSRSLSFESRSSTFSMFPGAQIRVTDNKSMHADERYEDVSALKNLEQSNERKGWNNCDCPHHFPYTIYLLSI